MELLNVAVCKEHEDISAECFYCDLTQDDYWKEKYLETAKQLMEVVEELFQLEAKYKDKELSFRQ
jgi:hypothetical protein